MSYSLKDRPPRISVRAIAIHDGYLLVQEGGAYAEKPGDPETCFAFIGGGVEPGDTLESRIRQEFREETNANVVACSYLFIVENRLVMRGILDQSIDHFFSVSLDRTDIESREAHISQHWLPIASLKEYDLRPHAVRDIIAEGKVFITRHVVVPLPA